MYITFQCTSINLANFFTKDEYEKSKQRDNKKKENCKMKIVKSKQLNYKLLGSQRSVAESGSGDLRRINCRS